jgi:hypothetical protein
MVAQPGNQPRAERLSCAGDRNASGSLMANQVTTFSHVLILTPTVGS